MLTSPAFDVTGTGCSSCAGAAGATSNNGTVSSPPGTWTFFPGSVSTCSSVNFNVLPYPGLPASNDGQPTSMNASFTPTDINGAVMTLDAAAKACGFAGFDWVQTINQHPAGGWAFAQVEEPNPALCDFISPSSCVPYTGSSDPPLGGYTYEVKENFLPNVCTGLAVAFGKNPSLCDSYYKHALGFFNAQPHFAAAAPFYYSPKDVPTGFATFFETITSQDGYTLNFFDMPKNTTCSKTASCFAFTTQLVGVCEGPSSLCSSASGPNNPLPSPTLFQWTWESNFNGSSGGIYGSETSSLYPADPGSGTGGVTIISINGVPAPTVVVTPSSSSVTTAEAVSVTVAVSGGSGKPTPTGSIILTSGTYTSAATTLTSSNATIDVPAGSLATGTDILMVSYRPDAASSSTYANASGFASVMVQDFTLAVASGSSSSQSASPGQTATYTLSVGSEGGFNQSVSFSCTGAPSQATCTVSPNSKAPGGNITVSATTTAQSAGALRNLPPLGPRLPDSQSLLRLAMLLAGLAWTVRGWRRVGAGQGQTELLPLTAGLLLALALAGCGGGGGGGSLSTSGTPAGTYNLTVTGTVGSGSTALSHSVTLTLKVS